MPSELIIGNKIYREKDRIITEVSESKPDGIEKVYDIKIILEED